MSDSTRLLAFCSRHYALQTGFVYILCGLCVSVAFVFIGEFQRVLAQDINLYQSRAFDLGAVWPRKAFGAPHSAFGMRSLDSNAQIWYNIVTMKCDFHIHTNYSDGICTPAQVVEMAKQKGLDCIAVTDHDTVGGVKQAQARAKELGLGCIVGAEISTVASCGDVHVLVYNVDMEAPGFADEMQKIADFRTERNRQMQKKFDENGIDIDIMSLKKDGSIGRGEIGREMVKRGICKNSVEAFDKYLGTGKLCYVATRRLTPVEAIQFALRYGGIPVLAHPKNLRMNFAQFEKFLRPLVLAGLGGIEAQYFTHNNSERKFFCKMAKKYKLIVTGGSDFHDYTHGLTLGEQSFSPNGYTRTILGI